MVRLLIEDVTLVKGSSIQAQVRFRGGATRTLEIDKPQNAGEIRKTKPQIIEEIDRLLDEYTAGQIATILNDEGRTSGEGRSFTARIVQSLCRNDDLKCRYDRLRERGLLTADELADALQVSHHTIRIWRREGLLQGYTYTDKPECLYDPPDAHSPRKSQGEKFSQRRRFPSLIPQRPNEVQHAT